MPSPAKTLDLSQPLAERVVAAARLSFPSECCGLIEGIDTQDGWRALEVHRTENLAGDPKCHFLIDPQAQFALLRGLRNSGRDSGRRIIGCFHSHPNGREGPSERDRASAEEEAFVWLIASGDPSAGFALSAHIFDTSSRTFSPVALRNT